MTRPARDASYNAGFSKMTGFLLVVAGDFESVYERLMTAESVCVSGLS